MITFVDQQLCYPFVLSIDKVYFTTVKKGVEGRDAVANLCVDHLILVSVDEFYLYWGLRVTLTQLLVVKLDQWEFVVHLVNKVVTFIYFAVVATRASVNLHEVSCRKVAL